MTARTGRMLWRAAVSALATVSAVGAQAPRREPANAALVYWQAFALLPDVDAKTNPMPDWRKAKIDARTRAFVSKAARSLRLLHKAAAIDACDWGIDWSHGFETVLPHLGKARRLAKLALLRAKVSLADKQVDAALADAVAAMRLSRHVAHRGVLVQMLVGMAVEGDVLDLLDEQSGSLTPAQCKALAAQLDRLPPGTDVSAAILAEKAGFVDEMIERLKKGGPKSLIAELEPGKGVAPGLLDKLKGRAILPLARDLAEKYVAIARAAALPATQAAAKLDELDKTFATSPNPFVTSIMPAIKHIFGKQTKLLERRRALREALRGR